MKTLKKLGTIARTLTVVLALADGPGGCATCGPPPPEPEPPRNDPLPVQGLRANPLSSARDG